MPVKPAPAFMVRLAALLLAASAAPTALSAPPAMAAPAEADFQSFFSEFRAAVLTDDHARVASMFALPFRDFAGGDVDRSAGTREQVLAQYDRIFTPDVIAAIRINKVRAFRPGSDDGEAPGPIALGEFLLDTPEWSDQLVFSPKGRTFVVSRAPFYS